MQLLQRGVGPTPSGFWLSDQTTVEFDSAPSSVLTLRYGYYVYSEYDDDLAWFDLAEGLLLAQTMIEMSPLFRDDKIAARYGPIVMAKLDILEDAQTNAEFDGQDTSMIPYADAMDNYLDTGIEHT